MNKQNKINRIISTLKVCLQSINPELSFNSNEMLYYERLCVKILDLTTYKGSTWTIKLCKELRLSLTKYVAGETFTQTLIFSSTNDGIPLLFGEKVPMIRIRDIRTIRNIMTVLQVSYSLKSNNRPSTETITRPAIPVSDNFYKLFDRFLQSRGSVPRWWQVTPTWDAPHISFKSGPNGNAMLSSHLDLKLLSVDQINDLKTLANSSKFDRYIDYWKEQIVLLQDINESFGFKSRAEKPCLGKLVNVGGPEGKQRVIAILDYWTQTALKPLHDKIFTVLKSIDTDCTFNQDKLLHSLKGDVYHSYDLTAATDRLPLGIQKAVIARLFGDNYALAWANTLSNRTFLVDWSGEYVKYSTGQPMGAYSSWCVFALTHHLLVRYSCWRARCNTEFDNYYALLGDDIVITNTCVASSYKDTMVNQLHVDINLSKTIVSRDTFEFAKRIFFRGREITAFPLFSVLETSNSIAGVWNSFTIAKERFPNELDVREVPGRIVDLKKIGFFPRYKGSYQYIRREVKLLQSISIIANKEESLSSWGYQTLWEELGFSFASDTPEEGKREITLAFLGKIACRYKQDQIFKSISDRGDLIHDANRKLITLIASRKEDQAGSANQTDPQSLYESSELKSEIIEQSPIARALQENIQSIQETLDDLDQKELESAFHDIIHATAMPVLNLSKIISRSVNLVTVAQHNRFLVMIRKEARESDLFKDGRRPT